MKNIGTKVMKRNLSSSKEAGKKVRYNKNNQAVFDLNITGHPLMHDFFHVIQGSKNLSKSSLILEDQYLNKYYYSYLCKKKLA